MARRLCSPGWIIAVEVAGIGLSCVEAIGIMMVAAKAVGAAMAVVPVVAST